MIEITPVGSYVSQWGEGPIWWEGALYYVDIEGHTVIRFDPVSGQEKVWNVGERVGAVVPRESGGLVIAGDNGFKFLDTDSGELTAIADPEPEKENNRFNDGKCSPDGRFFAGTISLVKQQGDAALYRLDPDGSCHEILPNLTNSNGIIWNEDGTKVFHIDTPTKSVVRFDYCRDAGTFTNGEKVIDTGHIEASPDGMTVDTDGHLWVAFCHGACVKQYNVDTGEELQHIDLPCLETTACAFGGKDHADLYVTTGVHKTEVEEHAGRLFIIRGLTSKGRVSYAFAE